MRTVDEGIASARAQDESLALLIIDLDQFKELNDALGHHAGDELLRQIGPRLETVVRSTDMLARLGGDEFGLLLGPPSDRDAALRAAASIGEALGQPFEIQGVHMNVAASIGIALYPSDGDDAQRLLQHADIAMYNAKAAGEPWGFYAGDPRDEHSRDALELAPSYRTRSPTASSSCASSRSPRPAAEPSSASRPWCAGRTRRAGCWLPTCSSRWRNSRGDARLDPLGHRRRARPRPRWRDGDTGCACR